MPTQAEKWNEWSMKVLEELTALNAQFESLEDKQDVLRNGMEERFNQIEKKIEQLNELLNGNGHPEKGIVVRLDRLEQTEERRSFMHRATIVSAIGAIVATVFQWLHHS
jgi:chromosome segregation ATPase